MKISLIVAMSENKVIGVNGKLPWHISNDLKRFKAITMGKPIVMGRKTFESIGKALPGRKNIVLTKNPHYHADGCVIATSIEDVLHVVEDSNELMVIGGAEIYRLFLPYAHTVHLTLVHAMVDGDAHFPTLDSSWIVVSNDFCAGDSGANVEYSYITYERSSSALSDQ